jgi:phage tail protein X
MTLKIATRRLGMMVDKLCFEALETDTGGVVEAGFDLNPGLAAQLRKSAHVLDLGQELMLPEPSETTQTIDQVTLWN